VVVVVCLATFLAIATMAYHRHQDTVYQRICWQQQRMLQGAIESLPSFDPDAGDIDAVFAQLVAGNQLPGVLSGPLTVTSVQISDPGHGPNSFRNYMLLPGSKMVGCHNHLSPFAEE
jgi:hypothetical protein